MTKRRVAKNDQVDSENRFQVDEAKIAMIQQLIPLGLEAINDVLQQEVLSLAGERYRHTGGDVKRWGTNNGSVYIGDKKVKIKVPRVRNIANNTDLQLQSYHELQSPRIVDDSILAMVINGISSRKYERAATHVPEALGLKSTTVSNKFIKASAKKLRELMERDLSKEDITAIFIDGKTFAENEIVTALGVNSDGKKVILGFIETSTENSVVIKSFMRDLVERGLDVTRKILFITDGSKGLIKGIKKYFKKMAVFQRCQWHKRENVVQYLPKREQRRIRKKLQDAYALDSYDDAKAALNKIKPELQLMNESAARSLEEGLEETLTLHKLGIPVELRKSLKTNNCIENLNGQLAQYTGRVSYWKNSNQRQRWVATAMLEIEPRLNRIHGHRHLSLLRERMEQYNIKTTESRAKAA